jgi:hypothetical protein
MLTAAIIGMGGLMNDHTLSKLILYLIISSNLEL